MTTTARPITAKQRAFATTLLAERTHDLGPDFAEWTLETLTAAEASALIDGLLKAPRVKVASDAPDVPAGRYAIEVEGKLAFFKVDVPGPDSRWHGWVFVKQVAGDEQYPVKGARRATVLAGIAADPREAMLRYGREIGSCGHCGRTLTDEASREAGIGPVCAGKVGF